MTALGKYKKEVASHGQIANTAARIQVKCNDLDQELLLFDHLMHQLDNSTGFDFEKQGGIALRR